MNYRSYHNALYAQNPSEVTFIHKLLQAAYKFVFVTKCGRNNFIPLGATGRYLNQKSLVN